MTDMPPGYDDWKTHNPDDDRCEHCGVHERECRAGWQPDRCTGECRKSWRDPDAEYERKRDDERDFPKGVRRMTLAFTATFVGSFVVCSIILSLV